MNKEEIQDILEELHLVRPEILQPKAKKLFEAIMSIADERDNLLEENKELAKEVDLWSSKYNKEFDKYKELHNKIDKAIEYMNIVGIATTKPKYFQMIKDTIWGEELLDILKDSDVDE